MKNYIYLLFGVFTLIIVYLWMINYPGMDTVANLNMYTVTVSGPEGTPIYFNEIGTGYINRESTLRKDLPVGTYILRCGDIGEQTIVLRQDIVTKC